MGHEWTEPTCTEAAICKRCKSTSTPALGHDVKEWKDTKKATCTEEGEKQGTCARCGETVTKTVPKIEHTPGKWEVSKKAGIDTEGIRRKKCTACGKVLEAEAYSLSEKERKNLYISKCKSYTFDQVARNPDDYDGKMAQFRGKVIQVMQDGDLYNYRLNVTQGSYGLWSDTIMVSYETSGNEPRILEDDIITVYGKMGGMYSYTSVMGATITLPIIYAEYIG